MYKHIQLKLSGILDVIFKVAITIIAACALMRPAAGMQIYNSTPASTQRFSSGMNTTSPVFNTDASFIGLGYDFSSVGWAGGQYVYGQNSRLVNFTLISPLNVYNAGHVDISNPTWFYSFINKNDKMVVSSYASTSYYSSSYDLRITAMTRALTDADNVSVMRVLDVSSGNYTGLSAFMVGSQNGTNGQLIANATVQSVGSTMLATGSSGGSSSFNYWESGDSGSPILIRYKGAVTIAGAAWFAGGSGSTLLTSATNDPSVAVNAGMAGDGYALRYTIYDAPTDTANTANVWKGTAGSSDFGTAANWTQNSVPTATPIVFDAGDNGGQSTVTLNAAQNVRGMLFRSNSGTNGFTIGGSGTLSIGATGIRNEDTKTQTFDVNIAMTNSQNWEAANGDLVFSGNIVNNYALVVQGAKNTTISGIISGAGGLAKDDTGILYLNNVNTYTGKTFIHDGTLSLGVANAISDRSIVQFDTANSSTLRLNNKNQVIGGISSIRSGTGVIALGSGLLTTGAANIDTSYSGIFTGTGDIIKTGTASWFLSGNSNAYSGNFVVGSGILSGTETLGGTLAINSGAYISPGGFGVGVMTVNQGMVWNGGGTIFMELGAPGSSDRIDVGSLLKGSNGTYSFMLNDAGGLAPGLYTLMKFGSTTFTASDFSVRAGGSLGSFTINNGVLQFQLTTVLQPGWAGGSGDNNWSTAANWYTWKAPTATGYGALWDTTANRTVIYDEAATIALKTLTISETSGYVNQLTVQKRYLTITDSVVLSATGDGSVAEIDVVGTSANNSTVTFAGGIILNAGGVLTVQRDTANANTGVVSGLVTLSGGTLGIGTKNANSGYLYMDRIAGTSGTIDFGKVNASQTLETGGNVNISGITVAGTGSGLLVLDGASNSFSNLSKGTGFKTLSVQLQSGNQSLLGVGEFLKFGAGNINFRGAGVKTLSDAGGNVGTISFDTRTNSSPATLKLGSNLAVAAGSLMPYATSYSGQMTQQAFIDANGYTLDMSAVTTGAGKWKPTSTASWAISSSQVEGRIKALSYDFSTTTISVGANVTLEAAGGNGSLNDLGTTGGTMDSTSKFSYTGAATTANAALLNTGGRTLGNLDVKNGALKAVTSSVTVAGETVVDSNGKLDLTLKGVVTDGLAVKGGGSIIGANSVTVMDGYISGDGSIEAPLISNGHFSPGANIDNTGLGVAGTLTMGSSLTFGANSILDLELGAISDRVVVGGNLSFKTDVVLNLGNLSGASLLKGDYILLSATGTVMGLDNIIKGIYSDGLEGSLSLMGSNVVFTVTAVPEPSSIGLLIWGGIFFCFAFLKRKRGIANPFFT